MDAAGIPRVWDWRYMVQGPGPPAGEAMRLLDAVNVRFYVAYRNGEKSAGKLLKPFQSSGHGRLRKPDGVAEGILHRQRRGLQRPTAILLMDKCGRRQAFCSD